MYTLFLDLSFEEGVCSLYLDGKLIGVKIMPSRDFITLHIQIDELLQRSSLLLEEVSVLAVAVGPGSYTGLRNAVAVIKAISYRFPHMKIVQLSSLIKFFPGKDEIVQISKQKTVSSMLIVDDAKIGGIYVQRIQYDAETPLFFPPELMDICSIKELIKDIDIISSRHSLTWFLKKIEGDNEPLPCPFIQVFDLNSEAIYTAILCEFQKHQLFSWKNVEVNYLRKTQAEIERSLREKAALSSEKSVVK